MSKPIKIIRAYLGSLGLTTAASLLVVTISELIGMGAFGGGFLTWLELSVCLTVLAWAFYFPIAIGVYVVAGLKDVGVLLFTVLGTTAGTLATWALSYLWPGAVTIGSSLGAVTFAFAVTICAWILALGTGRVRKNLSIFPTRKLTQG